MNAEVNMVPGIRAFLTEMVKNKKKKAETKETSVLRNTKHMDIGEKGKFHPRGKKIEKRILVNCKLEPGDKDLIVHRVRKAGKEREDKYKHKNDTEPSY